MGIDWSLLDGNPSPGDVGSILAAATSLQNVADAVDEIFSAFNQQTAGVGPDRWSGEAAAAFHHRAQGLPPHLHRAHDSFNQASAALTTYANQLTEDQAEAVSLLTTAQAASDAHRTASAAADGHRSAVAHLVAKQVQVDANLAQLAVWKRVAVLSGDPAAVQNYIGQEAVQRGEGRQISDAAHVEQAALRKADATAATAASSLEDARRRAGWIRDRQAAAGKALRDALALAHEAGLNESNLRQLQHWFGKHGPEIIHDLAQVLSVAATVCDIATIFCPALAPVALGLNIASAGANLLDHVVKYEKGEYGKGWHALATLGANVASDALSAIPPAKYFEEGTKVFRAAEMVEKAAPVASFGLDLAKSELEKPGLNGDLLWVVAEHGTGIAATKGISFTTHKFPGVGKQLDAVANSYAESPASRPAKPFVVSLLTSGKGDVSPGMDRMSSHDVSENINHGVELLHNAPDGIRSAEELDRTEWHVENNAYGKLTEFVSSRVDQ